MEQLDLYQHADSIGVKPTITLGPQKESYVECFSRVLVCGSRDWAVSSGADPWHPVVPQCDYLCADALVIQIILEGLLFTSNDGLHVIEGGAPGADSVAWKWAELALDDEYHHHFPADWFPADRNGFDQGAGPKRNAKMLAEGKPDVVLAFSHDIQNSKGTKDMVTKAIAAKIPYYIIGSNLTLSS